MSFSEKELSSGIRTTHEITNTKRRLKEQEIQHNMVTTPKFQTPDRCHEPP